MGSLRLQGLVATKATQRRTHTFNMWPQREVEKTSSWPNTTKIMTSLKMESSTIKAVLKLLLIPLPFAFLSTACSCSTATFVKAGDLRNDLPTIEVPNKMSVRDRLT